MSLKVLRALVLFCSGCGVFAFVALGLPIASLASAVIGAFAYFGFRHVLDRRWVLFDPERRLLVVSTLLARAVYEIPKGADVVVHERRRFVRTPVVIVDDRHIVLTPLDQAFDPVGELLGQETPSVFLRQLASTLGAQREVSGWRRRRSAGTRDDGS